MELNFLEWTEHLQRCWGGESDWEDCDVRVQVAFDKLNLGELFHPAAASLAPFLDQHPSSHSINELYAVAMRFSYFYLNLFVVLAGCVVARPTPVSPQAEGTTSEAQAAGLETDLRQQRLISQLSHGNAASYQPAGTTIDVDNPLHSPSSFGAQSRGGKFQWILSPMPVARTDVVKSMLSDKFNLNSNVPVQQILGPKERAAIQVMAGKHLTMPGTAWLHTRKSFTSRPQSRTRNWRKRSPCTDPLPQSPACSSLSTRLP